MIATPRRVHEITESMLLRATQQKKRSGEKEEELFVRVTHLQLMNKRIGRIGSSLLKVDNLRVLYLQENMIEKIEGVDHLKSLTHLYLQHNKISVIENLPASLVKLFLDDNCIDRVDGLEGLYKLKELSLASQRLDNRLVLTPACFTSFEHGLAMLNLSGNALTDTSEILGFTALEKLFMGRNDLTLADAKNLVSQFGLLEEVDFQGCHICRERSYLRSIIEVSSSRLRKLDGKPVQPFHRKQLQSIRDNNQKVQDYRRRSFEREQHLREATLEGQMEGVGRGGGGFDATEEFSTTRFERGMQLQNLSIHGVPEPLSPRSPREVGSLPGPDLRRKYA